MIYYTYITTNDINGKFYVGRHQCKRINDGYLGSGIYLQSSIDKYGRENFTRQILQFYNTIEELLEAERQLILYNLGHPLCMNINENTVGFSSINNPNKNASPEHHKHMSDRVKGAKNPMFGKTHTDENKELIRQHTIQRHKAGMFTRELYANSKLGIPKGFKHTDETKKKLSAVRKKQFSTPEGKAHMKYMSSCRKPYNHSEKTKAVYREQRQDCIFINNGAVNRRIKKWENIPEGFIRGMKPRK